MAFASHFAPFVIAVREEFSKQSASGNFIVLNIMRLGVIFSCVALVYVVGYFLQKVIGQEYVYEQVIVIEEDDENDGDDKDAVDTDKVAGESNSSSNNNIPKAKRSSRDKKKKV